MPNQLDQYQFYVERLEADEYVKRWVSTTLKNYLEKATPSVEEVEHVLDYLIMTFDQFVELFFNQLKLVVKRFKIQVIVVTSYSIERVGITIQVKNIIHNCSLFS